MYFTLLFFVLVSTSFTGHHGRFIMHKFGRDLNSYAKKVGSEKLKKEEE